MYRFLVLLAPALVLITACEADLESSCVSGPCNNETAAGTTTGAGGASCDNVPSTGDFPCDVYAALRDKCYACHTDPPVGGAPFPLLTFEHTRAPYASKQVWERMGPAIESGFMPLGMAPDLTADEKTAVLDWLNDCARPEANMGCECTTPAMCP